MVSLITCTAAGAALGIGAEIFSDSQDKQYFSSAITGAICGIAFKAILTFGALLPTHVAITAGICAFVAIYSSGDPGVVVIGALFGGIISLGLGWIVHGLVYLGTSTQWVITPVIV